MMEVTITGLEDTLRAMKALPKIIVARGYVKALSRGIGVIRYALNAETPVLKSDLFTAAAKGQKHPGDLKRALTTEVTLDSQFRGGTAEAGYSGHQGKIALWVEYGHRIVIPGGRYVDSRGKSRKGTVIGQVPAHAFMRRAYDASAAEAVDAVAESLAQTVKEYQP